MSARGFRDELASAVRGVRPARLLTLFLVSFAAALVSDWLREERVIFPAPLPKFTTVPKSP
jgi:hypothetical protein